MASRIPTNSQVGKAITSAVFAAFLFSLVGGTVKWLGQEGFAVFQVVFFRYFFGLLPVTVLLWRSGLDSLKTRRPIMHIVRGCLFFASLSLFMAGVRVLPLAEAVAILFTSPLLVAALSHPILGERVGARRWGAITAGFAGILIILRPGTEVFQLEALFALLSALCFSLALLLTRRMAATETNVAMLTYTHLGAAIVSLPLLIFVWREPAAGHFLLFLLLGVAGGVGNYLIILAYRHAPASVVAPFDYSELV